MAIFYKNQSKLEALARKTGLSLAGNRLSDLQSVLYGNRGNRYDELQYLRNKNTDATGTNDKDSDAWVKFGEARGAAGSNRADQVEREFYQQGNYP